MLNKTVAALFWLDGLILDLGEYSHLSTTLHCFGAFKMTLPFFNSPPIKSHIWATPPTGGQGGQGYVNHGDGVS